MLSLRRFPLTGVLRGVGRGTQGQELGAFRGAAVAGGLTAQTASEPGAEKCGRPAQFGSCGSCGPWGPSVAAGERPGVVASGQVDGLGDGCGDPLVTEGAGVESVRTPQPWIGGDGL